MQRVVVASSARHVAHSIVAFRAEFYNQGLSSEETRADDRLAQLEVTHTWCHSDIRGSLDSPAEECRCFHLHQEAF